MLRRPAQNGLDAIAGRDQYRRVAGAARRIPTGCVHRFEALDQTVELVEVSTPQLDDVERLEDDYGREGTSEA